MTRERGAGSPSTIVEGDPAFFEALGRAIKVARTQQDLSRKALASRAKVSYAYLSDIETGRGRPSSKALLAIAHALGRTPSELLQEAEMYGALHEMSAEPPPAEAAGAAEDRRPSWFHADDASASLPSAAASAAPVSLGEVAMHRESTRTQLQRLARSRLESRSDATRAELHRVVEGLSDADAAMLLDLARRLLRPGR
ncbi:MAG TPA: helix-turn-helix transcriptional regulator [Actinomycetota bacterium]